MSNDAQTTRPDDEQAPTALGDADSLQDVPAAAGGQDDSEPAQGEGETSSF